MINLYEVASGVNILYIKIMRKNAGLKTSAGPKRGRGRPQIFVGGEESIRLAVPAGTKAAIQAVLREGESMQAFIRLAIERQIERRS